MIDRINVISRTHPLKSHAARQKRGDHTVVSQHRFVATSLLDLRTAMAADLEMSDRDTEIAGNLANPEVWIRLVFMLLFAVAFYIGIWIGGAVALIQIAFKLISGKSIPRLAVFGTNLGTYLSQIMAFETFGSERRPWPMTPFPSSAPDARQGSAQRRPPNRTRVVKTAGRQNQDDSK